MAVLTLDPQPTPEVRSVPAPRRRPRRVELATVLTIIALLVGLNLVARFTPLASWFFTVPVGTLIILGVGRVLGLTWRDIGLSADTLKKGLRYGGVAAGIVFILVALGVLLPATRHFFLDEGYASARKAFLAAFVLIPIQTVLPEELAFRGVLHSSLHRLGKLKLSLIAGPLLFGLWHITSSLHLTAGNAGLTSLLGSGTAAKWAGVGLAVLATSLAGLGFTWLRHRSSSVLAPVGLHWALNAFGALAAAAAFRM